MYPFGTNLDFILDIIDYIILDIVKMDTIRETPDDAEIEKPELQKCFKWVSLSYLKILITARPLSNQFFSIFQDFSWNWNEIISLLNTKYLLT